MAAWAAFLTPSRPSVTRRWPCSTLVADTGTEITLHEVVEQLKTNPTPIRADIVRTIRHALRAVRHEKRSFDRRAVQRHLEQLLAENADRYNSTLFSQSEWAVGNIEEVTAIFAPMPRR